MVFGEQLTCTYCGKHIEDLLPHHCESCLGVIKGGGDPRQPVLNQSLEDFGNWGELE